MELIGGIILILIFIVTFLYGYFKYSFTHWKSRNIPYIEPSIPFGNIKGIGKSIHMSLLIKSMYDKLKPTGAKLGGVFFLARPVAILLDLDLIKSVLVKDFSNFDQRDLYYNEKDDPLSAHMFSIEGEKWRKLRAKLTPTFTSGKMKFMFPTIVGVGERFSNCLMEISQHNDQVEIKEVLARFTTDVIGTCAFGIECNSLSDPNAEFRRYGHLAFVPRNGAVIGAFINAHKNLAKKLGMKLFHDDVTSFFMKAVHETVEYREKNNINRNDFMDILIKLKNQETTDKEKLITMNELAAQAFLFFLAGFETSSSALTFCLYELAINPDVQSKARQIINAAFEKHGEFTYEMMMDMPYIDHLLQETLRKYPPLFNLDRVAQNDYHVPGTKTVIEKGTLVLIPSYAIQRDAEYYPEPEKFDPDRFDGDEAKKRDAMTWLPFGDGPRNCIGARFGMMQARIGVVSLLRHFEITLGSKTKLPVVFDPKSIFLSPEGGMYLRLKSI